MSVMNIALSERLHRRLSATAAAKGTTIKGALIEAASKWVDENAHYVADLGLSAASTSTPAPVDSQASGTNSGAARGE